MENEPSCIYINVDPECDRCPPAHGGSFYVSSTSLTYWISMFPDCLNYYEYFLIHTALFAVLAQSVQLSKLPGLLSVFSLNVLFEGESHRETWKNKILFFFLFLFCKCYVQFLFSHRPSCDVIHWQSPVTWSHLFLRDAFACFLRFSVLSVPKNGVEIMSACSTQLDLRCFVCSHDLCPQLDPRYDMWTVFFIYSSFWCLDIPILTITLISDNQYCNNNTHMIITGK